MLILFLFFVSLKILMIRTEDNIISIEINKNESERRCSKEVTLGQNSNFTLRIKSDFFISEGRWSTPDKEKPGKLSYNRRILNLQHSDLSMNFQRRIGSNATIEPPLVDFILYVRNQEAPNSSENWTFEFELLDNYDPWSKPNGSLTTWTCLTFVKIDELNVGSSPIPENNSTLKPPRKPDPGTDFEKRYLIIAVAIIVSLLIAQTSFMVYRKIRAPISLRAPKERRGSKPERNIANRAPLPLPPDEIKKNEPLPPVPVSSTTHGQSQYHYATTPHMRINNSYETHPDSIPKESYMNRGLETSEERVTSPAVARRHMEDSFVAKQPYRSYKGSNISDDEISNRQNSERLMQGPLVQKQLCRNKALGHSVEEVKGPEFLRRHEGPSVPQQPYQNRVLGNPDEDHRSPGFGRRHEGPSIPKQSYKNTALDDVVEETRTPGFARRQIEAKLAQLTPKGVGPSKTFKSPGPSIPQQSYRNAALDDSDEEIKTPGLARRQIEAKLVPLPPKGVSPSKSFKSPGPSIPQQSYRNAALDDSDEEIKTPGLARRQIEAKLVPLPPKGVSPSKSFKSPGPSIPQQSYKNAALDHSDEETQTPGFARRQIEAKLAQLPSRGVGPSKSFKSPIPLPRISSSPPPPSAPEKPTFHPAHRQEPAPPPLPPLHPKKHCIPAFPAQEACRLQESRRFSDDEWQYEKLQPTSKYLNNFADTPYE